MYRVFRTGVKMTSPGLATAAPSHQLGMLSGERIRVLRIKAQVRARRRSAESLLSAAEKIERVAKQARSDDARAAFAILVDVYRAELDRRQKASKPATGDR